MDKIKKLFLNRTWDLSAIFLSNKPPVTFMSFKKLQEDVPLCVANDSKVNNINNSSNPTRLQSSVT